MSDRIIVAFLLALSLAGLALAGPGHPATDSLCFYDDGNAYRLNPATNSNYWAVGFCRAGGVTRGRVVQMSAFVGNDNGSARVLWFKVFGNAGGRPAATCLDSVRTSVIGNDPGQWYSVAGSIPVGDTFYVAAWPSSSQTSDIFQCWDVADNAPGWTQWHNSAGTWSSDGTAGDIMIRCEFIDHDVGVSAILAPPGGLVIDSGQALTPAAVARDFGTEAESYPLRLRIGTRYLDSTTVTGQLPGDSATLAFADWTARERGNLAVNCYSLLDDDYFPGNDTQSASVFVRVFDAAVTEITAPGDTVDSGQACVPQARVTNTGNVAIAVPFIVQYAIDDGYESSRQIDSLAAGSETTVSFDDWTPTRRGEFLKTATSGLRDSNPGNDELTASGFVRVRDLGLTAIVGPPGVVDSGLASPVIARVANFGNVAAGSFNVRFGIGDGYFASALVNSLGTGESLDVNLADWTPQQLGRFADSAYTLWSGDLNPANNQQSDSVLVRRLTARDIGVAGILAPEPVVDSGVTSTVVALVRNFGTQMIPSFDVRFRIGNDTSRSATVAGLMPDSSRQVPFADWVASTQGFVPVCCSLLYSDQNPANDFKSDSVFAAVHDAGATTILVPSGILDSGVQITPTVLVENFGNIVERIPARLVIGADYADIESTDVLPGQSAALSFAGWTPLVRGSIAIKCSTRLDKDVRPANDAVSGEVQVRLIDVGPVAIPMPSGSGVPAGAVVPRVTIRNFGNIAQTVPCELAIFVTAPGETVQVDFDTGYVLVAPGESGTAVFRSWNADTGNYECRVRTILDADHCPDNDTLSNRFTVVAASRDVGVSAIVAPTGLIDTFPVLPVATVRNLGLVTENCYVFFRILDPGQTEVYSDSVLAENLPPGGSTMLGFPVWAGHHALGGYTALAFTALANDVNPANDTARGSFTIIAGRRDARALRVDAPQGEIDTLPVIPRATVKNQSDLNATFYSGFRISDSAGALVYLDSALVMNLSPGQTWMLSFQPWGGTHVPGRYDAECVTRLAGDADPGNDTMRSAFVVSGAPGPSGWVRMSDLPPGRRNKNVRDGGALAYGSIPSSLNPLIPASDTGYVYAFKGNNTFEFYRYNTMTDRWVTLDSIPAVNRNLRRKGVKRGASLAMGTDGSLYALKGNGTLDFWKYIPEAEIPGPKSEIRTPRFGLRASGFELRPKGAGVWVQQADVPAGSRSCREGAGAVAVNTGGTDYVYLLKGSGTREFYRYNADAGTWETLAEAPAGTSGRSFRSGSCLAHDGADAIYCLKGSTNEFYAYSVSAGTWETRDALPWVYPGGTAKKKVKNGAAIACAGPLVYALKGGNTDEFWRYECNYRYWFSGTALSPGGRKVSGGGALVYSSPSRALFAFRGNNTREFWMYNDLSEDREPPAEKRFCDFCERSNSAVSAVPGPQFALSVAPNLFTNHQPPATVRYSLPVAGNINLRLYDVAGKLVSTLARGHHRAGVSSFEFRASDFPKGVYILKLESGRYRATRKLVVE